MQSTSLRCDHIHGLIIGAAIGDALGYPRCGLDRRQAIKLYGRVDSMLRRSRDLVVSGFNTSQVIMIGQAVISSGTEIEKFETSFRRRLAGFSLTLPTDMKSTSRWLGRKALVNLKTPPKPSQSLSNDCVIRPLLLVLALHNTNLGTRSWTECAIRVTHDHPLAIEGCHLLARLANLMISERGSLNVPAIINFLSSEECSPEFSDKLKLLAKSLESNQSVSAVARQFGWQGRLPGEIVPTVIMSIYCFLRHPTDIRRAIVSAIGLGGDTSTIGSVVGALLGARLGFRNLPGDLIKLIPEGQYGLSWIEDLSHRLAYWPHGADDLHDAPPLPASPVTILRANLAKWYRHAIHLVTHKPRIMLVRT